MARLFCAGSERGFTLFTALVAFVLIVLAMLLVQSMISTERNVSETISAISEQEDMQAIADLSRADALQVFNYGIRYSIETFSTEHQDPNSVLPDNPFPMFESTPSDCPGGLTWQCLEDEFVKDRFSVSPGTGQQQGTNSPNKFATITAKHLIAILERSDDSRGYSIDLAKPDEAKMTSVLEDTFNNSAAKSDFFQVINCTPGNESYESSDFYKSCTGSFYVTLDLSKESVSDASYETFPQIRVENQLTHRILKEPIMPRGKVRIYVPTRLFKALAGGWVLAKGGGDGVFDPGFDKDLASLQQSVSQNGGSLQSQAQDLLSNKVGDLIKGKNMGNGYKCTTDTAQPGEFCTVDTDAQHGFIGEGNANGTDYGFSLYAFDVLAPAPADADGVQHLNQYMVTLYFKDTNPEYLVSNTESNIYAIRLYRTFVQESTGGTP